MELADDTVCSAVSTLVAARGDAADAPAQQASSGTDARAVELQRVNRGVPTVEAKVSKELQLAYDKKQAAAVQTFRAYCTRVDQLKEQLRCSYEEMYAPREGGLYVMTISDECRMNHLECAGSLGAFIGLGGAVAQCMNRRDAHAWGVPRTARQFEWRDARSGDKVITVIRDGLTDTEARAYAAWCRAHKLYGHSWTQGCEADGIDNPRRVLCGMRSERGAHGARIVEGFTVHSLQPRSGDTSNRLTQTYSNRDGKLGPERAAANPIDRFKWATKQDFEALNSYGEAGALHDRLKDLYELHTRPWLLSLQFPPSVCEGFNLKAHLVTGTLLINEGQSKAANHRDPTAPLPALVGGPGTRVWQPSGSSRDPPPPITTSIPPSPLPSASSSFMPSEGGDWVCIGEGGELYLADGAIKVPYGPRDLVLINGNFMHGVFMLRDPKGGKAVVAGRPEFERFSAIMFNTWQRCEAQQKSTDPARQYSGRWREEWWAAVPWQEGMGPKQAETDLSQPRQKKARKRLVED